MEHVKLVEDNYWDYRYEVDPVDTITSSLIRRDTEAMNGSTGPSAEYNLKLGAKCTHNIYDFKIWTAGFSSKIRSLFSSKCNLVEKMRCGKSVWSSYPTDVFERHYGELFTKFIESNFDIPCEKVSKISGVKICEINMSLVRKQLDYSVKVLHMTGSGLGTTVEKIEEEREKILDSLDPYGLTLEFAKFSNERGM